ncbi:MAG: hypothetical protein HOG08_02310 [Candidatus Magasanikbacteria bacterium]|nr:hypothetical protein [Candidatus Magasanikbacteria bacterium]
MKKIFILSLFLLLPLTVYAQYGIEETAGGTGLTKYNQPVQSMAGTMIGGALSIIGILFFILMLYGGFMWMIARGDEGKVEKGRNSIIAAVIGLLIVLSSYTVTVFLFQGDSLSQSTPKPAMHACVEHTDCNAPAKCRGNLCIIPSIGVCDSDSDCPEHHLCDEHQCVGVEG